MDPLQALIAWLTGQGGGAAGGANPLGGINLQQILQLISAIGGAGYGNQQLNAIQQLFQQQQNAARLALNPAALSRRALQATLPLNRNLQYQLTQTGEAAAANAGMGQSPGAVAGAVAREFAPYQEQNLQLGEQNATFGFPAQFATQSPDFLSVLNELNTLGRNTGGGAYSLPTP